MTVFALDPRLEADTQFIADWPLCRVLLMNDSRFPWLILVPRLSAIEVFDLDAKERAKLVEESAKAAERLKRFTGADKINVAALGNIVLQLHVHVIARKRADAAWPGPVWGQGQAVPYEKPRLFELVDSLAEILG